MNNKNIIRFKKQIKPELRWTKIEDIPNFPISNFEEVKKKINTGEFSVGIDFTIANNFATWLYGKAHAIFFFVLASTPFIVALISLILAFIFRNYWLLFGIILGFAGQLLSNPYNPLKSFWNLIAKMLFLVFLYGFWNGKETMAFLSAFFVFPFFINSFIYRMNQNKLKEVALNSEEIFIFLYQNRALGLRDNKSNKSYWFGNQNKIKGEMEFS